MRDVQVAKDAHPVADTLLDPGQVHARRRLQRVHPVKPQAGKQIEQLVHVAAGMDDDLQAPLMSLVDNAPQAGTKELGQYARGSLGSSFVPHIVRIDKARQSGIRCGVDGRQVERFIVPHHAPHKVRFTPQGHGKSRQAHDLRGILPETPAHAAHQIDAIAKAPLQASERALQPSVELLRVRMGPGLPFRRCGQQSRAIHRGVQVAIGVGDQVIQPPVDVDRLAVVAQAKDGRVHHPGAVIAHGNVRLDLLEHELFKLPVKDAQGIDQRSCPPEQEPDNPLLRKAERHHPVLFTQDLIHLILGLSTGKNWHPIRLL